MSLSVTAKAKINLFLHVIGKRDDGYHRLDSLVVFPEGIADEITAEEAGMFSFRTKTDFSNGPNLNTNDNLIVRAVNGFSHITGINPSLAITLHKNIPVGAGLGGGSADAAATVRLLEQHYANRLDNDTRNGLLLSLGADVPVCYGEQSCRMRGIGEKITAVAKIPRLHIALVWPGQPSFTKDIFDIYDGRYTIELPHIPDFSDGKELIDFLKTTENDLQSPAEKLYPVIAQARLLMEQQKGCALSRMTGSGSCIFGLFYDEQDALNACSTLSAQSPSWWVRSGRI